MSSQIKHTHSHQDTPLSPYTWAMQCIALVNSNFVTFQLFVSYFFVHFEICFMSETLWRNSYQ